MTSTLTIKRTLIIAAVTACTILSRESIAASGTCTMALQLAEDEAQRSTYIAQIKQVKASALSRFGDGAVQSFQTITRDGVQIQIDNLSYDCIVCHDGVNGSFHNTRFKSEETAPGGSIEAVTGSHPIGMHYGSAAYMNTHLRPLEELNGDMVFVNGRVGCTSCHNPLNPERNHLVMSNDNSNLCMGCHNS